MAAAVLAKGGIVECSHGGRCRLPSGTPRLKAGGSEAVLAGMEAGLSFAPGAPGVMVPCPFVLSGTPPPPSPCTATAPADRGRSQRMRVGGVPVLLAGAGGSCVNSGDPAAAWSVATVGQTVVTTR